MTTMTTTTRAPLPSLPAPSNYDIAEKSNETMEWLRNNIKIGFTSERGPAWWANATTKAGKFEIPDGSHFDGPVPMDEVRKLLDVQFAKGASNVTYTDADGNRQVTADADVQPIVNIRTGQVFSYPKKGYKIHPYLTTLAEFIKAIQYDQDVAVGSVGLLKGGGQAFLQAVLPETLEVAGYGYQPYLLGATSVDLSRSTSYTTGALGAVCDNTVTNALAQALTVLKIKHTSNSALVVQTARENLGLRLQLAGEAIGEAIGKLTQVDVSDADFALWMDEIDPMPKLITGRTGKAGQPLGPQPAYLSAERRRSERERLWTSDPKVAPWANTAFGILQLDNTYRTWDGKVTGTGGRIEQNFNRLVRGDTAKDDAGALTALAKVLDRTQVFA
jgi:phage/plasmid-like protein (TIGR03299 family)